MANSYIEYTADGSTTTFSVPFAYTAQADVKMFVDGVEDTSFTFNSTSVVQTSTTPTSGAVVRVERNTNLTSRAVDFASGSVLTEEDLDNSNIQVFFAAQEAIDTAESAMIIDTDGKFAGQARVIKNVADPTNAQDVVTKNWAETALSSQVQQATTQASNAATSATNASNSASSAASSASTATTKASEASTSASQALASKNDAETAETNAEASATAAATSASNAATSETNASNSASSASTSASTSTSQASVATGAASTATSQATSATNSANAASASASSASSSASSATTSASSASTSASAAQSARDAAEGYRDSASTSASNALTSANNASTSETNAATSATNAGTSATNAANSASAASTSASNASTSASEAAASAASIDTDNFVGKTATTGSAEIPVGTTAQRDSTPAAGMFRFNSTETQFEGYDGTEWGAIAGGGGGNNTTFGLFEHANSITANYSITANNNAIAAGPVDIATGVTVTIPTGSRWVIV